VQDKHSIRWILPVVGLRARATKSAAWAKSGVIIGDIHFMAVGYLLSVICAVTPADVLSGNPVLGRAVGKGVRNIGRHFCNALVTGEFLNLASVFRPVCLLCSIGVCWLDTAQFTTALFLRHYFQLRGF
jgi:hypothetical protein